MNPPPAPPLHPDLLALLASCRASPADDTPRLVLADWLDEHADAAGLPSAADARARADLIRTQVELDRPTLDAGHAAELRAWEHRLLHAHAAGWLGGLPRRLYELAYPPFGFGRNLTAVAPARPFEFDPLHGHGWRFERGLLVVRLRPSDLADAELGAWFASPLAAWTDEARVDLSGAGALEALEVPGALRPYLGVHYALGAAEFPTLQQPRARRGGTSARQCRRLLRCANFPLVRGLRVYRPAVDAGFLRFLAAADVSGLRRLDVQAALSDADAGLLAAAPLTGLSALNVAGTGLTGTGLHPIANAPHLRNLVSLVAFRNPLGHDGLEVLCASPLADRLNVLEVQNTGAGDRGVEALVRSPLLTRLHGPGLNLSMNTLGDGAARALAACEHLGRFRELILRDGAIGDAGAAALAASPHAVGLSYLDLWKNRVGDAGAAALAASPHLGDVRLLSLRDNLITAAGGARLQQRFGERAKV